MKRLLKNRNQQIPPNRPPVSNSRRGPARRPFSIHKNRGCINEPQTLSRFVFFALFFVLVPLPGLAENTENNKTEKDEIQDPLQRAFHDSRVWASFRYRYELVDQDGFTSDAKASTLRSRLGFETGDLYGFSMLAEVEDVQEIGNDLYNNTLNGRMSRPVVADPEGTEINQAFLSYQGFDSKLIGGRYRLVLDNSRFVGDVGWRQNNQTFDGATLENKSIEDLKLFYGYVHNVNRIFGDDSPRGDIDSTSHLFNVKYSAIDAFDITTYAYLLDLEDLPGASTLTFGARLNGKYSLDEAFAVLYDGEFAYQEDYEDNPLSYDSIYFRADGGIGWNTLAFRIGFESLGSDNGIASFSTPLATLHKWNGFADIFLTTPAEGLEDAYAVLTYKVANIHHCVDGTKFLAAFHDFSSDEGSIDYGTEWDFNISQTWRERYTFGVKYANYSSDDFGRDTEKLIFTAAAKFSS